MPSRPYDIHIVAHPEALQRRAAEEFVRHAEAAVQQHGHFSVALSGGSTPKSLYALLASTGDAFRTQVPWDAVHFFWGDERHVPPDHPDSNYRMTHEAMFSKVPVPAAHIHRIEGETPDADNAAAAYEQTLRDHFRLQPGQLPRFDLVLLGMGPDGHTASLFPGTKALHEQQRLVVANWVEKFNTFRITCTVPVLNNAAAVVFLVSGEDKTGMLRTVLEGEKQPEHYPSQLIRPTNGKLLWLADQAAARLLEHQG
jgi:6-phosphogluconolactonase